MIKSRNSVYIRYEYVQSLSEEERRSVLAYFRFMNILVPSWVETSFQTDFNYCYRISDGALRWTVDYEHPFDEIITLEELKRISKLL